MANKKWEGKWDKLKGNAKKKWGKLTDDDLKQVEGDKDKLVGKVKEKYGVSQEEAEKQVNEFDEEA